ncbi:hypothetical protein CNMCM6106_006140 [Aspergillus hiratsukae]|nr:hypothetical protein CNMCM6106_006140 [Aspergillus hiratsukae]
MGGEVPSVADGVNATMTPNSWEYVFVYDIAGDRWYNQTTTGTVASRTEFCAVLQHDPSSPTYEVYVLGGADYMSKEVLSDVSYLSIPSFHWHKAADIEQQRMSLFCQAYGPQVFGIGGRINWADDQDAGCYTMPAFIYDVNSETSRTTFDPAVTSYSQPSAVAERTKVSPYPATWADSSLRDLFVPKGTSSSTASALPEAKASRGASVGAIVGGVVGGVALIIVIVVIAVILVRRKKRSPNDTTKKGHLQTAELHGHCLPGQRPLFEGFNPSADWVIREQVDALGKLPLPWWLKWNSRMRWFNEDGTRHSGNPRTWERRFSDSVQEPRQEAKIQEVGEEEKVALLGMLRAMLAFRLEERPSATEVMEGEWMQKWALPELAKCK